MDIDNSSGETIPMVSAIKDGENKNKMKYIIIAVVAAVVIIAVAVTIAVVKSKNKNNDNTAGFISEMAGDTKTDDTESVSAFLPADITIDFSSTSKEFAEDIKEQAATTSSTEAIKINSPTMPPAGSVTTAAKPKQTTEQYLEATTVLTGTPAKSDSSVLKQISSFFSGKYYFDGDMVSNGTPSPLEIAMVGSNIEMFTEFDSTDIAILMLDGKTYLLNPDTKKYMELTASVKKMVGISDEDLSFSFNKVNFDANNPASITAAKYNGADGTCYTYSNSDSTVKIIAVGNEIKQITLYGKDGNANTVLKADEFSSEIPSGMLSLQGYSKTNMISFFSGMM